MKIKINDECGSHLISVLTLDGTKAIEGEDYITWKGVYHQNGKWSYSEGGVALKNGIVVFNKKSTHYSCNNRKYVIIVENNKLIKDDFYIMGRLKETESFPENNTPLSNKVFEAVVKEILSFYGDEGKETLCRWKEIEKFL
jgi:hypothetical protein